MPLTIIYTDRPITEAHFNGYDAREYAGTLEEAREELAYWVEQGWATAEATDENAIEITDENMQGYIREYVLHQ